MKMEEIRETSAEHSPDILSHSTRHTTQQNKHHRLVYSGVTNPVNDRSLLAQAIPI
jgi:hypothetical protein